MTLDCIMLGATVRLVLQVIHTILYHDTRVYHARCYGEAGPPSHSHYTVSLVLWCQHLIGSSNDVVTHSLQGGSMILRRGGGGGGGGGLQR